MNAVAVVVVNFGSHELIRANFGPLDLAAVGARLVVVDNHRSAADTEAIRALATEHGWHLVETGRNAGFGAGANAGARVALAGGADVLVVANPDLAMTAEVVAELAAVVRADHDVAVAPRIVRPDGSLWFGGGFISLDDARTLLTPADAVGPADVAEPAGPAGPAPAASPRTPPWISGACFAMHRDLWTTVAGFDDDYFMYWEDVDLSYRVVKAGGRLEVRQDLVAVHDVGGTQHDVTQRAKSSMYYYYSCRNRLVFAAKHLDRRDRRRWVRTTPADSRRVLLRGGRRQLVAPHRTLWPVLKGAAAGAVWLVVHRARPS
jgi:N-acetylglucosaminyl-diphospho-decaprenol L-rhamnosyltransferase